MKKRKLKVKNLIALISILLIIIAIGVSFILRNKNKEVAMEPTPTPTPTPVSTPTPTPTPEPEPVVSEATLFMVGDALIHGAIYEDALTADGSYEFSQMLDAIAPIAQQYDLAYYNQETILGGSELGISTYPMFNTPQEFGRDMIEAGFNLVSTATNHTLDKGEDGVLYSKEFWKAQEGVVEDGTNTSFEEQNDLPIHEVNGITYAFISYTYGMNGLYPPEGKEYLVNCYENHVDDLLEKVRIGKEKADVVIVAMHWGIEYMTEPSQEQMDLAQQLADAGADIIIGNHPHIIQPIQWLNDHKTICFYALGNFISAQEGENLVGMMASLKITKTQLGDDVTIDISDVKADLHYTYSDYYINNRVIPFSQLSNEYQGLYQSLLPIVTQMDDSIQVGGFE